jgi:F420-non-reducing hydrogenase small subunit
MADRLKLAVNWAGACGGCDVALLDAEAAVLELAEVADVVYWPVAMDYKRSDLASYGPGEIDIGLFNGVVRTSEHAEDARMLRSRCRFLVAFGACAAFGGIPGLANLHERQSVLDCVYAETPSTDNPEDVRPETATEIDGHTLELPAFDHTVKALAHVVDIDMVVPGCPPPMDLVVEALELITACARAGELPPKGTVLASDKAQCDTCPRVDTRTGRRMPAIHRRHLVEPDPDLCFLEQGIVCLGLATRGGCGSTCIRVNMPCRGCFGPTDQLLDPGAEALSAIGSIAGVEHEDDLPPPRRMAAVRSIVDVVGTFYRFTLPSATLFRRVGDGAKE